MTTPTFLINNPLTVRFVGGPRDGVTKQRNLSPKALAFARRTGRIGPSGCYTECMEQGIPVGVYRQTSFANGTHVVQWYEQDAEGNLREAP